VIVERSTVPVKTASAMTKVLTAVNRMSSPWVVLSNPEFATEGNAVMDQASPERIMIGGGESDEEMAAVDKLAAVYARWVPRQKIIVSGLWSAELSKMTANAFLAQRVSSINAISALCEVTGADVTEVSYAIGVDSRIGRKGIQASVGYGGTCYETHLRNLVYLAQLYRLQPVASYWEQVIKMNSWQKRRFAQKVVSAMFNTVSGKKLTVLGFSYKKNTSDTRFSAAIDVCKTLVKERAHLCIYDPRVASEAVSVALSADDGTESHIEVSQDPYVAATGAHAILLLTEWDEFKRLDYERIYASMVKPAFIFDGRNLLDHDKLREVGFNIYAIGKAHQQPAPAPEVLEQRAIDAAAAAARVRAGAAPAPQLDPPSEEKLTTTTSFGAMA